MTHERVTAPTRSPQPALAAGPGPRSLPMRFQQLAGNRAFARLQAKLTISQPGDAYEVEADRVADHVMRLPEPYVQRECACGGTCADCKGEDEAHVQRATATSASVTAATPSQAPDGVDGVLHSPGKPLDDSTRSFMEARFGHDFASVRVHDDAEAIASARAIEARAYTVGSHIVFGEEHRSRSMWDGRHLLAHELTHVVQQGGSARLIQRQRASVHAPSPGFGVAGVPFEKWSPEVEAMYRKAGHTEAADGVRHCRESSSCLKVLTESEAYSAYRSGRISAGMGDPGTTAVAGAVAAPSLAPSLAPASEAAAESAAARAAARWGAARVIQGGAAAAEAAAAGTAASVGTVLVPLAVGVYVTIAIADLIGYASFQMAIRKLGYVVLPAPLGVCIGLCHQAPKPRTPDVPPLTPLPRKISDEDVRRIAEWLSRTKPSEKPVTPPVPLPKPKEREDEDRKRCRLVRRAVPRGNDPLSELFCSVVMPGVHSYDIYSPVGWAEIDALAGRTWYECKCGYGSLVRQAERGDWLARVRLDEMDEQIRRHMRIAAFCGLIYRFVVSREDVAELVRSRHWDVDVLVVGWEPCE